VEIKIKWIPRKQMTHENTYRDDTHTDTDDFQFQFHACPQEPFEKVVSA
jgi:hypothetical protein